MIPIIADPRMGRVKALTREKLRVTNVDYGNAIPLGGALCPLEVSLCHPNSLKGKIDETITGEAVKMIPPLVFMRKYHMSQEDMKVETRIRSTVFIYCYI